MLRAVANPAAGGQPGSFTTLTVSGNVTLTGGTANGVAYLNGSKVLTSGAGLTSDGAGLSATGLLRTDLASAGQALILNGGGSNMIVTVGDGSTTRFYNSGGLGFNFRNSGNSADVMAITDTGVTVTGLTTTDTLRVNVTPTAEVVVATHTAVFNINGTNYKFLCLAA